MSIAERFHLQDNLGWGGRGCLVRRWYRGEYRGNDVGAFLIAVPDNAGKQHLKLLSKLARNIMKEDFRAQLHGAKTRKEAADIISQVLSPAPSTDNAAATSQA